MNKSVFKTMRRNIQSSIVLAGLLLAVSAGAQTYPSKPIRVVVPWPAGGLVDVAARQLGQRMQNTLGQPLVIENKVGAGGNIGADLVAKSAADGHTLLFTTSALTINAALRSTMPFDPVKDFERVAVVAYAPAVLVVNPNSSIRSLDDLVKAARSQPGKLSYASAGVGSPAHLMSELFKSRQNIFVVHIPYTGAPAAMNDQIAGRIDFQFANAAVALPQVKAGKVRAIAVTSTQRLSGLPDVPTMAEAGMKEFEIQQWIGLMAPQGTHAAVVNRLVSEVNTVLALNEFGQALSSSGTNSAKPGKAADFDAYFKQDLAQWVGVVKAADIKPE
jgi:tripartite-type tricarboxylate transporter receptor subunit TctC